MTNLTGGKNISPKTDTADGSNAYVPLSYRLPSNSEDPLCNAEYLNECERVGIPADLAACAGEESHETRNKWWGEGGIIAYLTKKRTGEGNISSDCQKKPNNKVPTWMQQSVIPQNIPSTAVPSRQQAKANLLITLQNCRGDVAHPRFLSMLNILSSIYLGTAHDARKPNIAACDNKSLLDGSWIMLSRPSFAECLGQNRSGDFMYSLGRMSFDMFRPSNLRCSIQGIRNEIKAVSGDSGLPTSIPWSLRKEVQTNEVDASREQPFFQPTLRTYNIVVLCTIEPRDKTNNQRSGQTVTPSSPIQAVLTNDGFTLPDPNVPNRFTVWFTGGALAPFGSGKNHSASSSASCCLSLHACRARSEYCSLHGVGKLALSQPNSLQWDDLFGQEENWKQTLRERANSLAAKMLLGAEIPDKMEEDGTMNYKLHRPLGGHGSTYIDVLYLDKDLRISRGNAGTIFVQARRSSAKTRVSNQRVHPSLQMEANAA